MDEKRLIIVGAGGFGREVYAWATDAMAHDKTMSIGGFLDRDPNALDGFGIPHAIIADPEAYEPRENEVFVCAIGQPAIKLKLGQSLRERGARFFNLIHPTAIVGPGCILGEGVILCPFAVLTCHVTLGDFVILNIHAGIGHDAVLGDGCTLSPNCSIAGGAHLGRGVFVGSHATVLPGVSVGDSAVLGAGSAVVRKVPAGASVMGVPAKQIWLEPCQK